MMATSASSSSSSSSPSLSERVTEDVSVLGRSFRSGLVSSLDDRRQHLLALQRLMDESEKLLCDALWKDLRKSPVEAMASEITLVNNEIQQHLDYLAEWAAPTSVSTDILNVPGRSEIVSDPLGVCCVFGAWNYPVMLSLMPLVGCLSAGNTCLLRVPSCEYSAESSKLVAALVRERMDPSVVRVVEGDREATRAVLAQRFDKIFFTGGSRVGKMVARAAAEHLCPTVLELGGKTPCVVDASADVVVAARRSAWGAFMNAGQTCIRPDYVLVHRSVADEYISEVSRCIADMYGPLPCRDSPFFGRIVNARAHGRLVELIRGSERRIVCGGDADEDQLFIAPTVMDFEEDWNAFASAPVMSEEIFGPIMPVVRYETIDEVIRFIRERPKPLALYVFGTTKDVQDRLLTETSSGSAVINDCMVHMTNCRLPFGGVGSSGTGSYHGKASFDAFSHKKSVLVKTNFLDVPQRYPPYTPFARKLLLFLLSPRPRRRTRVFKTTILVLALAVLGMHVDRIKAKLASFAVRYLLEPSVCDAI